MTLSLQYLEARRVMPRLCEHLAPEDTVLIDTLAEEAIADDAAALIDMVAGKLLAGDISGTLRGEIERMLALIPAEQVNFRVAEVIYLIVTSPEFAYQG